MRYSITCTGPGGTKTVTSEGGGTVIIGLAAGDWRIGVEARYNDMLAGRGEGNVAVRAGASNAVTIKMTPTDEFASPVIIRGPLGVTTVRYLGPSLDVEAMTFLQETLLYQWYVNTADSNAGGSPIPGAVNPVYAPPTGTPGTMYYYVEITGAGNRSTVSGAAAVTVVNPDSLTLSNAKTAEGGAYGINEPFRYQVIANAGGESYDISASLEPSNFSYNFSTPGTKTVTLAPASPLNGIPLGSPVIVVVKSITDRVAWANTQGGAHTLLLYADEAMPSATTANIDNAAITIKSGDESAAGMRTLSLSNAGNMFVVSGTGAKLTLGRNLTLQGLTPNTGALVFMDPPGGELVMEDGSVITGNGNSSSGGGVFVQTGTFTMNGGTISGNTASSGGGVQVGSSASFTMNGGTISGNDGTGASPMGGGVYVLNGATFNMNGGVIGGDTAAEKNTALFGGGVYVDGAFTMNNSASVRGNAVTGTTSMGGGVYVSGSGAFTMNNSASVRGNAVTGTTSMGGGVYVGGSGSSFTMNNSASVRNNEVLGVTSAGGGVAIGGIGTFVMNSSASVSGNETTGSGGGVYVGGSGSSFTMNNAASISGNTANGTGATDGGGGVCIQTGTFTMNGSSAAINNNAASAIGGGVLVYSVSSTFNLTNGTVYGINNPALQNTATSGSAIYTGGGAFYYGPTLPEGGNTFANTTVIAP
jgi:hypothetical protein